MSVVAFEQVLVQLKEVGSPNLSPALVADKLSLQVQELASVAGVHRNTLRIHPDSPKLQEYLRNLMRILSAASAIQPDVERAIFFIKNSPIPAFQHKTAYQLAGEGRTDDVINYLESISSGFVG